MIYRMRTYKAIKEKLGLFHEYFSKYLLTIHLKHGTRLIGRWETEDGRVVAIFEYDNKESYQRISGAIEKDPEFTKALEYRKLVDPLFDDYQDTFMVSTLAKG